VQFVLFDVSATLVFLVGYLAVVALQRRRALPVAMGSGQTPRREWPRLSYPR
jgi:hypothetical protein